MESGSAVSGANSRWITSIVAVIAGSLFVLAGWLSIKAADLRWGPACMDSWDAPSCIVVQDHRYDYVGPMQQPAPAGDFMPDADWVPIPGAAQLAGIGLMALAAALALMLVLTRSTPLGRLAQAVVVLSVATLGGVTTASGMLGHPLAGFNTVTRFAFLTWGLLGPLVLAFTAAQRWAIQPSFAGPLPESLRLAWMCLLLLATPMLNWIIVVIIAGGYNAFDSMPWDEAAAGGLYVLTGLIIIAGVGRNAVRRSRSRGRGVDPAANFSGP